MTSGINASRGPLQSALNHGLNVVGATTSHLLSGHLVTSGALGYIGGWLVGVGSHVGLLQGVATTACHHYMYIPAEDYIDKNKGDKAGDIDPNNANYLKGIIGIAAVATPILATMYFADTFTQLLSQQEIVRWLVVGTPVHEYGWITGGLVSVAPVVTQHAINFWREADKSVNKRSS